MAEAAAQRAIRLLDLVPYLLNHPGITLKEVANTFEVGVPELLKDLDLLFMCGLPGYTPLELIDLSVEDGVVSLRDPQNLDAPRRFTQTEALIIRVGLAALEELLPSVRQERVKSLREKFARLYTNDIPVGAIHFTGDADKLKLKSITEAVAKERRVAISYRNPISSNITERELSVIKIVPETNRTLIEAWCHNSNGIRTFNLANILKAYISNQGSEVKPDAKDLKESFQVKIELKNDGRFYSENQDQLVKEGDAYSIEIFQTEWLIRSALAEGGDMAIIEPKSIGVEVANRSKEALREYSRES
ncbi:MAG: hypothetical protein RLZZ12_61 [Actinomycetota bacterium]|jgi:proteasome accessory factor C